MKKSGRFWRMLGVSGAAAVAFVLGVRAVAAPPVTSMPSYTGCLKANGTIDDVAPGILPASHCNAGKTAVTLSGGDITNVHTGGSSGLRGGKTTGDVDLSLAPIPAARVKGTTPLLIAADTLTQLPLDQVEFDTASLHGSPDTTMLVAPLAGIYSVSAHVCWPQGGFGSRDVYIDANIGIVFQRVASSVEPGSPVAAIEQSISSIVQLGVGDSVQLEVRSSGTDSNMQVGDHCPTLTMAWLGPAS
jgi:hypothetical protein